MKRIAVAVCGSAALALSACGGGGGSVPAPISSQEASKQLVDANVRLTTGFDLDRSATNVCTYMRTDEARVVEALTRKRPGEAAGSRIMISYKCPELLARFDELVASVG